MARRFAKPDVAGNHGRVDAILKELADVARDLLAQIGPLVVHRQDDAGDLEAGIVRSMHAAQRGDEVCDAFERKVLAIQRDEDRVGRDERVEREQPE